MVFMSAVRFFCISCFVILFSFGSVSESHAQNCPSFEEVTEENIRYVHSFRRGQLSFGWGCLRELEQHLPARSRFVVPLAVLDVYASQDGYYRFFYGTSDYIFWRRRFLEGIVKYSAETGDLIRAQAYLNYLFYVIDPAGDSVTNSFDLFTLRSHPDLPEQMLRSTICFVQTDDLASSFEEITETASYIRCIERD